MTAKIVPVDLRCEYQVDPLAIDTPSPRLSWHVEASNAQNRGLTQAAYRIRVAASRDLLSSGGADLWDSGPVPSRQTLHIPYEGKPLAPLATAYWTVDVCDDEGTISTAPIASWRKSLTWTADLPAAWISSPLPRFRDTSAPAFLRRDFVVEGSIARATLTVTALGVYEAYINNQRIGNEELAPGWTDYTKRIAFQTHDVTSLITQGRNALGAILGDGWYAGYVGFEHRRNLYGNRPQLLALLTIEYGDGRSFAIGTDDAWRTACGPIQSADLQMGEFYDARLELGDWTGGNYDAAGWTPVSVHDKPAPTPLLVAQVDPPVRVTERIAAQSVTQPSPGTFVFDLGQNIAGRARLKVTGPAGTIVRLRHAEILEPNGNVYLTNLRAAEATDTYILKGGGPEEYEPRFTFHGFRYVEVTGYPLAPGQETPPLDSISGSVLESDTPVAGSFVCSHTMVNQLYKNLVWGQRDNFLSIPTDCPQRDERLGWMGDAQIFVRTASLNRDVSGFFTKWVQDVVDAQYPSGAFQDVSPTVRGWQNDNSTAAPAWGDAGIIVPWTVAQVYGDQDLLTRHYDAMRKWVDYLTVNNPDGIWRHKRGNDYGDWLSIEADTDKELLATAYYAYDASLLAKIALWLGDVNDADRYETLSETIKAAFVREYLAADGTLRGDTQTAYVLALRFDLLPEADRPAAAKRLADNIRSKNNHLSTGFVGVGYLCPVLSDFGYNDLAYALLLNETFPSWGYSVKHGATTIWERWDGWTEDKGFQTAEMNSFNHYSLGSVGEWLFRYVAGIDLDTAAPGFERLLLHPRPDRRLSHVSARYDSIRGPISSSWRYDNDYVVWRVDIPANTTATIVIDTLNVAKIIESGGPVADAGGVAVVSVSEGRVTLRTGSGQYEFRWPAA